MCSDVSCSHVRSSSTCLAHGALLDSAFLPMESPPSTLKYNILERATWGSFIGVVYERFDALMHHACIIVLPIVIVLAYLIGESVVSMLPSVLPSLHYEYFGTLQCGFVFFSFSMY